MWSVSDNVHLHSDRVLFCVVVALLWIHDLLHTTRNKHYNTATIILTHKSTDSRLKLAAILIQSINCLTLTFHARKLLKPQSFSLL